MYHSKEVFWKISNKENHVEEYSYLNKGDKIVTKSNTDWSPQKYDIGPGMNAVYLQG